VKNLAKKIVLEAIKEVNLNQDSESQIGSTDDVILLGIGSSVDSLALVRLLVEVERIAEENIGNTLTIVDESTFESVESPFASVGSLISHVELLLRAR